MSIHILTTDPKLTEQLTQLLAGGQQPFHFHDDLETIIGILPKLKKTDKIFYDLQLEPSLLAFEALRFGCKKTNLIAFELLPEGSTQSNCPKNTKHYLLLSSDLNKSGVRLKKLLHEVDTLAVKKKRARKKTSAQNTKKVATQKIENEALPITLSRYLTVQSKSMQQLLARIAKLAEKPRFVFLEGEDGADFELTAHEINFRTNGDQIPLHIADPMRIDVDEITTKLSTKDETSYCYIGLSYELGTLSIARLTDYFDKLKENEISDSSICFILGHVDDSEGYLETEVKHLIKQFRDHGEVIQIPNMSERRDDISQIVQSVFNTLRSAHPFLMTRMLSRGAIDYLEAQCGEMSYSSLVRIIRNSMALTERDTLTEDELKSFGDDSPTSQHLIESLADEKFFKNQTGAA
jgi:hypothetical protein